MNTPYLSLESAYWLPKLKQAKLLVVGDVMLDRYWFSEVQRISPEAPVPIAKVEAQEERAGGAANVARNAASLGTQVTLLTIAGTDEAADCLKNLLQQAGVSLDCVQCAEMPTIVKLRVMAKQQQLLRIDFETPPPATALAELANRFQSHLQDAEVVIFSDYGKGSLAHIQDWIQQARALGKQVLVDPKGDDYSRYQGATLLTPNRSEFRQVAGSWQTENQLTQKAQQLRQDLHLEALLVTRSEDGMSLYQAHSEMHQATHAQEVFDVSGAGDTVIATLGAILAAGGKLEEAVQLANRAAGIVVAKLGTAVVQPHELFEEIGL